MKIKQSSLSEEKKKILIRTLLVGEPWSWVVSGISEQSVIVLKENKFKKPSHQLDRHHIKPVDETIKALLHSTSIEFEEWSKIISKGERTHIVTCSEHKLKEDYTYYPVPPSSGLFPNNKRIGFRYQKPE